MNWISNFIAEHYQLIMIYLVFGIVFSIQPLYTNVKQYYERVNNEFIRAIYGDIPLKEKLLMPVVFVISFIAFVLFWPIFGMFHIKDLISKKKEDVLEEKKAEENRYLCRPEFFVKQVSIEEVIADTNNYYPDPLGIAPQVVFGYLNSAWLEFSSQLKEDEELWEFLIPAGSEINRRYPSTSKHDIRGYARVQDQKVLAEFVADGNRQF
jgi:hypothetical protein